MKQWRISAKATTFGLLVIWLLITLQLPGYGQEQKLLIPLKQPDLAGLFNFENPKGSIAITGYDGNMIVVTATPRFQRESGNPELSFDMTYEQKESSVTLYCDAKGSTIDVDVKIPRHYSLQLRSLDNGDVSVIRIQGEVVVDNVNGSILLDNISGSAVLNSVYGDVTARFKTVSPAEPIMITTLEGNIELAIPEETQARLKTKSSHGRFSSELDLIAEVKQASALTDWSLFKMNGGGAEFILRTYNGNIRIKRNL